MDLDSAAAYLGCSYWTLRDLVVLVIGEQDTSLLVQPTFQQGGDKQVPHTLVVVGV